jgi:DNA repair protein SbcC/Rad50
MRVLSLMLRGFRGIRDGMGRDVLELDFERLAPGAALVAIAGANGRGKTTVMDNLHPYLLMPSRASTGAPGGFSYYEHVVLPESEKTLVWEMDGRRYRSQLVIRCGGRPSSPTAPYRMAAATATPVAWSRSAAARRPSSRRCSPRRGGAT